MELTAAYFLNQNFTLWYNNLSMLCENEFRIPETKLKATWV